MQSISGRYWVNFWTEKREVGEGREWGRNCTKVHICRYVRSLLEIDVVNILTEYWGSFCRDISFWKESTFLLIVALLLYEYRGDESSSLVLAKIFSYVVIDIQCTYSVSIWFTTRIELCSLHVFLASRRLVKICVYIPTSKESVKNTIKNISQNACAFWKYLLVSVLSSCLWMWQWGPGREFIFLENLMTGKLVQGEEDRVLHKSCVI